MASGGQNQRNPKTSSSEPRQRSSWQRTTSMSDKDDNVSLNSFPNDLRPNNWVCFYKLHLLNIHCFEIYLCVKKFMLEIQYLLI